MEKKPGQQQKKKDSKIQATEMKCLRAILNKTKDAALVPCQLRK